jgi:hypothetical protein
MNVLGIDIGGSGIKGAVVDTDTGELVTERKRFATPQPSKPEAVVKVVTRLVKHFNYQGPIGVGFPAIVIQGVTMSAANVDNGWEAYTDWALIVKMFYKSGNNFNHCFWFRWLRCGKTFTFCDQFAGVCIYDCSFNA